MNRLLGFAGWCARRAGRRIWSVARLNVAAGRRSSKPASKQESHRTQSLTENPQSFTESKQVQQANGAARKSPRLVYFDRTGPTRQPREAPIKSAYFLSVKLCGHSVRLCVRWLSCWFSRLSAVRLIALLRPAQALDPLPLAGLFLSRAPPRSDNCWASPEPAGKAMACVVRNRWITLDADMPI